MSSQKYQKPGEWEKASGGNIPHRAVAGGVDEGGETIYVARAKQEGDWIPGKLVPSHGTCYVSHAGKEHGHKSYQVLVNKSDADTAWLPASNGEVPSGAFQGGQDESGEMLYIGRAHHEGTLTIGKVHRSHGVCYVPYGGDEHAHNDYEVLVCKTVQLEN